MHYINDLLIQVMDSHIAAALEHKHLCMNFIMNDRMPDIRKVNRSYSKFNRIRVFPIITLSSTVYQYRHLEALGDHKFWDFKCPDNWHHGNLYGVSSDTYVKVSTQ